MAVVMLLYRMSVVALLSLSYVQYPCVALVVNDAKGIGISSLHRRTPTGAVAVGVKQSLFAGTKRGVIVQYRFDQTRRNVEQINEYVGPTKPQYPIYSMVSRDIDESKAEMFCGGGDRYISVWQLSKDELEFKQRLGPHTGWVKDLAFDSLRNRLHSLGCNRIETWGLTDAQEWSHVTTRAIESSPNEGATLSSDLLCITMNEDDDCIYAGGVDGRIHVWSSNLSIQKPVLSVGAHDGRVNILIFSSKLRLLFSSGHGGSIQCRTVYENGLLSKDACGSIQIWRQTNDEEVRVTSATLLFEKEAYVSLILGTSAGMVHKINAQMENGVVTLIDEQLSPVPIDIGLNSQINAIVAIDDASKCVLVIGHSNGIQKAEISDTKKT